MALSSQQQNKVIQLLGYGGKTIQAGSVIYNNILNQRLNLLLPDTEVLIDNYLTQIAAIELQMNQAPARLAAKVVGDLTMNLYELQMLRAERKRIGKEIAALLDIPYVGVGGPMIGMKS